jgi:hypothetical protein
MQDVEIELRPVDFAPPAPPLLLSAFVRADRCIFSFAPAGWSGDWHPSPRRQILLILSGQIEVEVSDGELRLFGPGSILLDEDTTGKGHRSRVLGKDGSAGVFVQLPI